MENNGDVSSEYEIRSKLGETEVVESAYQPKILMENRACNVVALRISFLNITCKLSKRIKKFSGKFSWEYQKLSP